MRKQLTHHEWEERFITRLSKISRQLEHMAKQARTELHSPPLASLLYHKAVELQRFRIIMLNKFLAQDTDERNPEAWQTKNNSNTD